MANEKHIVRFWRGSQANYEVLKKGDALDYWTRYTVQEPSGLWVEYFGANRITTESGQLLPVNKIVEKLPQTGLQPGDRYLVGPDEGLGAQSLYYIVEVGVKIKGTTGETTNRIIPLKEGMSVRVKENGYMSYQVVGNQLITYDEVDCGTY